MADEIPMYPDEEVGTYVATKAEVDAAYKRGYQEAIEREQKQRDLEDLNTAAAIRQFCLTLKLDEDQIYELCQTLHKRCVPPKTADAILGKKKPDSDPEVQFDFEFWRQF